MGQNVDMVTNPAVESSSQLLNFIFSSAKKTIRATCSVLERVARDSMHFTKVAEKTPKKQLFEGDCWVRSYCTKTNVSLVTTLTFTKSDCQAYHEWNGSD